MIRILVDNRLFGLFLVSGLGLGLFVGRELFRGFLLGIWADVSEDTFATSGAPCPARVSSKLYKFDVCVQVCLWGRGFLEYIADRIV